MDLGGAAEQSRPDRSPQIGQRTCQQPSRHLLREVDEQSSPWSLPETEQETVSSGSEKVFLQCKSGWQIEQVASRSRWRYQRWCLQEPIGKDTWCPDELLHGRTCVLLAPWLHGCRFVSHRVALPGKIIFWCVFYTQIWCTKSRLIDGFSLRLTDNPEVDYV